MSEPFGRLRQFLRELKRRNVYKVAVAYLAVAFVSIQAAQLLVPPTTLPGWADDFLIYVAVFGFPIALVIAWAFEMTPEGVRRTPEVEPKEGAAPGAAERESRLAVKVLVGLGVLAGAVAGGWYLTGGGGEPEPAAGDRSIAVLPFEELGEAEPGTFTEGMHDDLLARLSNVSGLKVISRTSVQQYRDTEKTTAEIARELGVRWVLEGGVQEMGDEIQVNAQLIDPRTDTHAWAERYRRDLTAANLFDLQSEITKKIARSLEARLTSPEQERVERQPTENLTAYRLYVQGRNRLDRRTAKSVQEAKGHFQRALQEDSTFALAWVGLADTYLVEPYYSRDKEFAAALPRATAAVRRALDLNPALAEAHASRGALYIVEHSVNPSARTGPAALRHLQRAGGNKTELRASPSLAEYDILAAGTPEIGASAPAAGRPARSTELGHPAKFAR